MKKILSFLSTISLSTIIITNIIACQQANTNKQNNKQIKKQFITQQPPKNSKGKLINNIENEFNNYNNKGYLMIAKNTTNKSIKIIKFKNNQNDKPISPITNNTFYIYPIYNEGYSIINLYYGNENNEPNLLEINFNTGEIINGNKKIES